MTKSLLRLPRAALAALASAFEAGQLNPPYGEMGVGKVAPGIAAADVARDLEALRARGLSPEAIGAMLRVLVQDRTMRDKAATQIELVWTGPELPGSRSRDTAVVVGELFASAERSVLVSAYALFHGRELFAPLAARMEARPDLRVQIYLNIMWDAGKVSEKEAVSHFAADFKKKEWPGCRLPEVFYDPRSLETDKTRRAVLHAKCVVVDSKRSLITSANFTEAAHERNIEAGVVVDDPALASALERQFTSLVTAKVLKRLPL